MAVYVEWTLHAVARKQPDTYAQRVRMVHAASVRALACSLRMCVRGMRRCGHGRGGRWARMSGSEKVAWKFQRAWMRLLEDGQRVIGMGSSFRSCLQWFTPSESLPQRLSSACEEVPG